MKEYTYQQNSVCVCVCVCVWHCLLPIGSMNRLLQKHYTTYMSSSIFWKVTCLVDGCVRVSNKISLAFYIFFLADYR